MRDSEWTDFHRQEDVAGRRDQCPCASFVPKQAVLYRARSTRTINLPTQPQIEVYTDGQCNLCRWMRTRVEPLDRNHRLEWLDYNQPDILKRAAPHTREEMAEQMHARPPNGRWYKGYFAWIEIIRVLPRWKWLAPVMGVWPLTKLGPIFYHWLASRRYSLFGVPPPCDESGVCQLHK